MLSPSISSGAVNISTLIMAASRFPAGTAPGPNSATRCISCASAPAIGSDISVEMIRQRWAAGSSDHASPGVLRGARRGDRLADRRERRAVVELNIFANPLQSEVAPQRGKVRRHRLRPHLVVEPGHHVDADGLVGGCKNALDRPVLLVIAAGREHAA